MYIESANLFIKTKDTTIDRHESLDKSNHTIFIVVLSIIIIALAWYMTNMITKSFKYHQ